MTGSVRFALWWGEKLDVLIEHIPQSVSCLEIKAQASGDYDIRLRLTGNETAGAEADIDEPAENPVRDHNINHGSGYKDWLRSQIDGLGSNLGVGQGNVLQNLRPIYNATNTVAMQECLAEDA
jgi:hypothetical protein